MNTNFKDLIEESKDMSWAEKEQLIEAVEKGKKSIFDDLGTIEVKQANGSDENFIISSSLLDDDYLLTSKSAEAFLKDFSQEVCEGQDPLSYCAFQQTNEKE